MPQNNIDSRSTHHHSGLMQKSARLYGKLLQKAGEKFIGRAHAGRAGRAARIVRVVSTGTSLGVGIAATIIISTSVASGGTAVPVWLIVIGGVTLVTNSAAIAIGAAANHMKIGQYYDRQAEMHANNEALRQSLDHPSEPLPHGIRQYWRDEPILFRTVMGRRVHDSNAVGGSTLSIVSGLASLGVAAVSPDAAVALFTASRSSAILSAGGAHATNWHRLKAYRTIILRFGEDYRRLTQAERPITAALVERMLAAVLNTIQLDKSSHYAGLLEYHLYKAIFSVSLHHRSKSTLSPLNADNWQKCVDILASTVKPFLIERLGKQRLNRDAIRAIDRDHIYTTKPRHAFMDKLSVLDGFFVLEMVLRSALIQHLLPDIETHESLTDEIIATLNINTSHDSATRRLQFYIISALYESSHDSLHITERSENLKQSVESAIVPYLKPETKRIDDASETGVTILDCEKLAEAYPMSVHAHGGNFHLNFHMEMLRESIRIKTKNESSTAPIKGTNVNAITTSTKNRYR